MANQWQIGNHKTSIYSSNGFTCVRYHQTEVVRFNPKQVVLNSGGWHTATTKTRMNQASRQFGLGYDVYQKDWNWFVDYRGQTFDFYDGITLTR